MAIVVTNIQRMCFHDGPGIRTTVFLKGCSIHCPWCANPETIRPEIQYPSESHLGCERQQFGRKYQAEELVSVLLKDEIFWGEDGGVTFSGGEPLMQAKELKKVWDMFRSRKIHMAVETALFVPEECVKTALEYLDFFYVDVKLLEPTMCRTVLGGNVELYWHNMQLLAESGKQICFRVPCSEEYVLQPENLTVLYGFFKQYRQFPVQIFAIHNLGDSKYYALRLQPGTFRKVSQRRLEDVRDYLEKVGIHVEIIGI